MEAYQFSCKTFRGIAKACVARIRTSISQTAISVSQTNEVRAVLAERAEPGWRQSHEAPENVREVTLVGEAGTQADLTQADVRITQKLLGALETTL